MFLRWITGWVRRAGSALMPGGEKQPAPGTGGEAAPSDSTSSGAPARDRAYVSEFTRFMEDFMAEHPEVLHEQRSGWAMYWNRKVDFDLQEEAVRDTVPPDPYYYFATPPPAGPADEDETPGRA